MKAFIRHTRERAERLSEALDAEDIRVALMHYAPVPDTLHGERLEIHPFLGSYLLAEAVDQIGADLALHGHRTPAASAARRREGFPFERRLACEMGACTDRGAKAEEPAALKADFAELAPSPPGLGVLP